MAGPIFFSSSAMRVRRVSQADEMEMASNCMKTTSSCSINSETDPGKDNNSRSYLLIGQLKKYLTTVAVIAVILAISLVADHQQASSASSLSQYVDQPHQLQELIFRRSPTTPENSPNAEAVANDVLLQGSESVKSPTILARDVEQVQRQQAKVGQDQQQTSEQQQLAPPTTENSKNVRDDHEHHKESYHPLRLIFSLAVTVTVGMIGGRIAERSKQSTLLGMLIAGILARNLLPSIILPLPHAWTGKLWGTALSAVTARAGLSLQLGTFFGTSSIVNAITTVESGEVGATFAGAALGSGVAGASSPGVVALMMGTIPILGETLFLSSLARMVFGMPVAWSFTLAFGVASISPGVVVPLLLGLLERREWAKSKLPTTLLAATGLDVLVATTGFGVSMAAVFGHAHEEDAVGVSRRPSTGIEAGSSHSGWFTRGVEEVGLGVMGGILFGTLALMMRRGRLPEFIATYSLFGLTTLAMLTAKANGFPGAASSCVILTWAVVTNIWDKEAVDSANKRLKLAWKLAEPFLFPVIGASVCLTEIRPSLLLTAMLCVSSSILVKMGFAYLVSNACGLIPEETLFACGVWSGKASVQAALSTVTLEAVHLYHLEGTPEEVRSRVVFACMISAIILGGPLAALWVSVFGERGLSDVAPLDSGKAVPLMEVKETAED